MRRYAVRFIVAVLTFAIGVALSLAFGLFRSKETTINVREYRRSPDCPKRFRVTRPSFLSVDSQSADPLVLVYLGSTPDITHGNEVRMRFTVGNRTDKTISGYWISANEIWKSQGQTTAKGFDWTAFEVLEPGETNTISLPGIPEGASVRVARVTYRDGSTWDNPRVSQ
jgi:hypothetical protein